MTEVSTHQVEPDQYTPWRVVIRSRYRPSSHVLPLKKELHNVLSLDDPSLKRWYVDKPPYEEPPVKATPEREFVQIAVDRDQVMETEVDIELKQTRPTEPVAIQVESTPESDADVPVENATEDHESLTFLEELQAGRLTPKTPLQVTVTDDAETGVDTESTESTFLEELQLAKQKPKKTPKRVEDTDQDKQATQPLEVEKTFLDELNERDDLPSFIEVPELVTTEEQEETANQSFDELLQKRA